MMIHQEKEYSFFFKEIFNDFRDYMGRMVALEIDHMGNPGTIPSLDVPDSDNIGDYYFKILSKDKDELNEWFKYINMFERQHENIDSPAISLCRSRLLGLPTPSEFLKHKKEESKSQWYYRIADIVKSLMGFSIFRIDESNNSIYYAYIDHPILSSKTIEWLQSRVKIAYGQGSTGFITRSGYPLCLGSTDADLRGTVSIEDFLQGNQSFIAFPIIGKEHEEDKLFGVVACFFPLPMAFWNKNARPTYEYKSRLCRSKIKAYPFQIAFDKELGRYKVGIEKFLRSINLMETITDFEQIIKGTTHDEGRINIGNQAWYSNLVTKVAKAMELPLANVLSVREDQNNFRFSFVAGEFSEAYFLPRVYYAIDKASELSRWKTRAHIQTEIYLAWIQGKPWIACVALENTDPNNEAFTELLKLWDSHQKDGQCLKSAVESLEVYQYKGATPNTMGQEPVQDILVPLGFQNEWIGVLRINCDVEVANAKIRCNELIEALKKPLVEEHFSKCIIPLLDALRKIDQKSEFIEKKRANDFIANYANILVRWLASTDQHEALEREFQDFINAAHFLKYQLAVDDVKSIKDSIQYIHNVLSSDLKDLIIVLSIWTWRNRVSICDDVEAIPVLYFGDAKCELHKALKDDKEYSVEYLTNIETQFNNGCCGKSELSSYASYIQKLADEFFSPPTFKLIERLVLLGINELTLSPKRYWSHGLDVNDVQDWNSQNELFSFGTNLAQEDYGFRFIYIFPCEAMKGCYWVVFSEEELTSDDLNSWNKQRQTKEFFTIESIWGRHKKAIREASHYVEGNIKRYFINRDIGFEFSVNDGQLINQFREINETENDLSNNHLIQVETFAQASQSTSNDGITDPQTNYQHNYVEKIVKAKNKKTHNESTIWKLAKNLDVRWLYVIPIVTDNKLVSIIHFYSAYRDPLNPRISNFTGPNQSLFQLIKSYYEDRLTLDEQKRRIEREILARSVGHGFKNAWTPMSSWLETLTKNSDENLIQILAELFNRELGFRIDIAFPGLQTDATAKIQVPLGNVIFRGVACALLFALWRGDCEGRLMQQNTIRLPSVILYLNNKKVLGGTIRFKELEKLIKLRWDDKYDKIRIEDVVNNTIILELKKIGNLVPYSGKNIENVNGLEFQNVSLDITQSRQVSYVIEEMLINALKHHEYYIGQFEFNINVELTEIQKCTIHLWWNSLESMPQKIDWMKPGKIGGLASCVHVVEELLHGEINVEQPKKVKTIDVLINNFSRKRDLLQNEIFFSFSLEAHI